MLIDLSGKRVVITGAAGFVGSHLVDACLATGARVLGLDNFLTGHKENLLSATSNEDFTFVEADVISDPREYLPSDDAIDIVLHFASPASPPSYQKHPVATYQVNAFGTHALLQHLREYHPKATFVYASTSEVYGDPEVHPQVESYWGNVNPNGPRSCYDEAKRLGETVCGVFATQYNLDTRIVRIFNTFGPRMDPKDGRVIPNFVMQALHNEPITVYGDGTQTRSYCFVDDLVEGILLMSTTPEARVQTINLGNDAELSILDTAQKIIDATGSQSNISYKPLPKDDPTRRRPDISKAASVLGWQPKVAFNDGLRKTIAYFSTAKTKE